MTLIHLDNVTISFHGPPLLDAVSCRLEARQRIGLLGRNGAGKTTFMRLVSGQISPDDGRVVRSPGVRIAQLRQDVPQDVTGTLSEVILSADAFADDATQHDWWHHEQQVEEILTRMNLDSEARFETLSSGMKRRVLLAQAIASDPDLLLLDEPTNHLDVDSILWLEEFLAQWRGALLFVTHDRAFLRRLATRILEIDRGKLFDWSCDYDTFLQRKDELLAAEEKQNALFDKRLAEEERWIRQGIKARRTRNEGRVRALKEMRDQRSQRRDRLGTSNLNIETTRRSGALVAEAEEISFRYNGDERMAESEPIFTNFSTVLMRGDKVGVVGPNGAGKTTLLRVLLGELQPTSGKVKLGTNLDIVYFDQLRGKLDEEETVEHAVGEGYNTIELAGRKKHIYGYLQDFLFTPERARTQIKFLSGGERNRVLLAKLFAKPANVVVLDEPTNDLDAETMEMLEERLIDFPGTLLVVSHDRVFLDNVVSSVIAFEPGGVREYVGGYTEWVRQRDAASKQANQSAQSQSSQPTGKKNTVKTANPAKAKLSYKDQRELDKLPALIEKLEAELAEQNQTMADPDFYQQPKATIAAKQAEIETLQEKLTAAYARWEALEG